MERDGGKEETKGKRGEGKLRELGNTEGVERVREEKREREREC